MSINIAKSLGRGAGALGAALAVAVLTAAPASAHVHATADDAVKGGYTKITFRVPNEEENANTTKLQVSFPAEYPVPSASTKPVSGWTAKVRTEKLTKPVTMSDTTVTEAVSTITWTASAGGAIKPNEFQEFDVSAGPLPDNTGTLVLPTVQTYSNGDVVRWVQPTKPGAEEPEHPAPEIALSAAEADGHTHAASNTTGGGDEHAAEAAPSATDDTARWLGGAGLVVGALGLGAGAGAILRGRRSGAGK